MSKYLNQKYNELIPYQPGEQPKEKIILKLNTNESPFAPSIRVQEAITKEAISRLRLYNDPTNQMIKEAIAKNYGVKTENVCVTGGSDEMLNYAIMAYGQNGMAFADVTYSFYRVFCDLNHILAKVIPLQDDWTVSLAPYKKAQCSVLLCNPNAPTGIVIKKEEIAQLAKENTHRVVIVDEAYGDFAEESMIPYISQYDNLLVIRTFSKSRSLAGARIGYAIGNRHLIDDLERIRNSCNPYAVTSLSQLAAREAMNDKEYFQKCVDEIKTARDFTYQKLLQLGFRGPQSSTNFLFVTHPKISGEELYQKLRNKGILVRHFSASRIQNYNRITIGTKEQMEFLITTIKEILT